MRFPSATRCPRYDNVLFFLLIFFPVRSVGTHPPTPTCLLVSPAVHMLLGLVFGFVGIQWCFGGAAVLLCSTVVRFCAKNNLYRNNLLLLSFARVTVFAGRLRWRQMVRLLLLLLYDILLHFLEVGSLTRLKHMHACRHVYLR